MNAVIPVKSFCIVKQHTSPTIAWV